MILLALARRSDAGDHQVAVALQPHVVAPSGPPELLLPMRDGDRAFAWRIDNEEHADPEFTLVGMLRITSRLLSGEIYREGWAYDRELRVWKRLP